MTSICWLLTLVAPAASLHSAPATLWPQAPSALVRRLATARRAASAPSPTVAAERLEAWLAAGGARGLEDCGIMEAAGRGGLGLFVRDRSSISGDDVALVVPAELHLHLGPLTDNGTDTSYAQHDGAGQTDAKGSSTDGRGTAAFDKMPGGPQLLKMLAAELEKLPEVPSMWGGGEKELDTAPDLALLSLALAHEQYLGHESEFAAWVDTLPRGDEALDGSSGTGALGTPWLWTVEEREALPPALHSAADAMASRAARERAAMLRVCHKLKRNQIDGADDGRAITASMVAAAAVVVAVLRGRHGLSRWRWARATAFARVLQLSYGVSFVPGCDAANHSDDAAYFVCNDDDNSIAFDDEWDADDATGTVPERPSAVVVCDRDRKAGEELMVSYGAPLSNSDLTIRYGFVLPERRADECEVAFAVPDGEEVALFFCTLPVGPTGRFAKGTEGLSPKESHRRWRQQHQELNPGGSEHIEEYWDEWGVPHALMDLAHDATAAGSEVAPGEDPLTWLQQLCDHAVAEAADHQAPLLPPGAPPQRVALATAAVSTELAALERLRRALQAKAAAGTARMATRQSRVSRAR